MSKIFTRTFRVRWSELDASGAVSSANYLRYLIETAWDWGDAVGLGVCLRQQRGLCIDTPKKPPRKSLRLEAGILRD